MIQVNSSSNECQVNRSTKSKKSLEAYESRAGKGLDEKVGEIVGAGDTTNVDGAVFNMLTDIVKRTSICLL